MTEGLLLYRADQIAREQVTAVRTRWLMDRLLLANVRDYW